MAFGVVHAVPIQWPSSSGGNDHYYEFVPAQAIEWSDAQTAAAARTFNGQNGYLATLTSAAEDSLQVGSDERAIREVHSTWINAVNAGDLGRWLLACDAHTLSDVQK
jgi:hypothetical protein